MHSWEQRARDQSWAHCARDPTDANGDPVDESDDEDAEGEDAEEKLIELLVELKWSGRALSARSLCVICWWASRLAGAKGIVGKFALRPSSQSGKFQPKLDKELGISLHDESQIMTIKTPGHWKGDFGRTVHDMPVIAPSTLLKAELAKPGVMEETTRVVRSKTLPPAYYEHKIVKANVRTVVPLTIYLDGVPFLKKDSVVGIFVYCPITGRRHLAVVLRKSHMCKCGCRGWCTLYAVHRFLQWDFQAMMAGTHPRHKPCGVAYVEADGVRFELAGTSLDFLGAGIHIKGDLMEMCTSLALPGWRSNISPCLKCWCTRDNMHDFRGASPRGLPWPEVTNQDYHDACTACEFWRLLTAQQHRAIRALLFYDKSEKGQKGRCLLSDVPALNLLQGDRLEPHAGMADIGAGFDTVTEFPVQVLFWRSSLETRARRRNPLFDEVLGIWLNSIAIDSLHAMHLGVCAANAYRGVAHKTDEIKLHNMGHVKNELFTWYKWQKKTNPGGTLHELQDLRPEMLTGSLQHASLSTKAAECKTLTVFVRALANKFKAVLQCGAEIAVVAHCLVRFSLIMDESGPLLSPQQIQDHVIREAVFVVFGAVSGRFRCGSGSASVRSGVEFGEVRCRARCGPGVVPMHPGVGSGAARGRFRCGPVSGSVRSPGCVFVSVRH